MTANKDPGQLLPLGKRVCGLLGYPDSNGHASDFKGKLMALRLILSSQGDAIVPDAVTRKLEEGSRVTPEWFGRRRITPAE